MRLYLIIFSALFLTYMTKTNSINIEYILSMPEPSNHYFEVEIRYSNLSVSDKFLELLLPVWRPGRYFIFDFASGVQEFSASDKKGKALNWFKKDKSTWRVETSPSRSVVIKYRVFANEFEARTRGLDQSHAFVNPTAVFMYCQKYRGNPLTLKVKPFGDWHVTTGLDNDKKSKDPNRFTAPDYDYFTDCPLEIGNQKDFSFDVEGREHVFSFYGEANYDKKKIAEDFTKIIKKNYELWGSVPYKKYIFIVHCTPVSGGGTEHINSTVVGVKPAAFDSEKGYTSFLRLISHEFFHTWNVKQLKPKGITPYDFQKENYLSELWIAEGGTSYYDGLMLVRTGQMNLDEFLKEITGGINDERSRPGNRIQSVAESSFDAWVKFWRRTPNSYESESDYYRKGSYVCLVLDLAIRNASKNKYSLDDVFRKMFEKFPLDVKGYTNEDFQKMCEKFAGKKLDKFFNKYVSGTEPIDWDKFLGYAGLKLSSDENTVIAVVGIKTSKKVDKIIIDEVLPGSSGQRAGLLAGDEIIAYDNQKLDYEDMENRIKELRSGDRVTFNILRSNILKDYTLIMEDRKVTEYHLEKIATPTNLQRSIYEDWLETKW